MQISGIGAGRSPYFPQNASTLKENAPQFGNLVAVASQKQADVSNPQSGSTSDSIAQTRKRDFYNMTPADFGAEGSAMYKRGEIDFDTMTAMVLRSDSIARMDAESGKYGSHDFKEVFKGYMSFLEKSGSRNDPTSGYHILEKVMSKIA